MRALKTKLCLYSSNACLINPLESFLLPMFFAAYSISNAEANSAAANSFKTKQHLSGSNFLIFVFGIKNILLTFIFFFLFTINSNAKSKNCLPFVPYGWNDFYVHLPQNSSFCVNADGSSLNYITDIYGGRILLNEKSKNWKQVFGDSQVVGIDIDEIEKHYLSNIYKNSNLIIYAAPNNGPYEVINFLTKNKKILEERITITFNFAVDIYRISNTWHPTNYVAIKDYQLDEILENPNKYKFIILKNLLIKRNFTLRRFNNKKMQNLFLNKKYDHIHKELIIYFKELDELARNYNLKVNFIVTHPYWIYSRSKNKLKLDTKISNKVYKLVCKSFNKTPNIDTILISKPSNNLSIKDLTIDKRHIKSQKITLVEKTTLCNDDYN